MNKRMNFFTPFIKEKPKSNPKRLLFVILGILLVFGIFYLATTIYLEERELKYQCEKLDAQINAPERVEAIARIENKQDILDQLNIYVESLKLVKNKHEETNIASDILISAINAQIPEKLFLTDINFSGDLISFKGSAVDHDNISQFVHNLRNEEFISNVGITSIVNNNSNYDFDINAELNIGNNSEQPEDTTESDQEANND